MKRLSALPGGEAVFALPECVRAALGTSGQSRTVGVHSGQLLGGALGPRTGQQPD